MMKFQFWNREYAFEDSNMPSRMEVGGENILTAPARLRLMENGCDLSWNCWNPIFQKRSDFGESYVWPAENEEAMLICETAVRIEKDGFMWFDTTLIPYTGKFPKFDSLWLEIPLAKDMCQLMYLFGTDTPVQCPTSGAFPSEDLRLPFTASLWVGKEERGLCLMMENPAGCRVKNKDSMIELIHEGDTVLLRVHLLDEKPPYWCPPDDWGNACEPLTFSFALMATPVKQYRKVKDFDRAVHGYLTGITMETVKEYYERGVKYIVFHEDWSLIQNYNCCADPAKLHTIVNYCHEHGMKVMVYFGYEFSSLMPDFAKVFRDYAGQFPHEEDHFNGHWLRKPPQKDYVSCYKGGYSDVMLEQVAAAMDEYHLDGIYTDGTVFPQLCANERHGCGWRDEEGKRRGSYPILAYREHVRKLNDVVKARGGIWDAHTGGCCIPAILGFADTYWDGEASQEMFHTSIDRIDFSTLRAQYIGRNWGVPSQFIIYASADTPFECISGLLILCGVYGRPLSIAGVNVNEPIWKAMDEFGVDDAEFCPAWEENGQISTDSNDVYASCWIKNGKALAAVYNRTKEPITANVTCLGVTQTVCVKPRVPVFIQFAKE